MSLGSKALVSDVSVSDQTELLSTVSHEKDFNALLVLTDT